MDFEQFERDLKARYKRSRARTVANKVDALIRHVEEEWQITPSTMNEHELRILTASVLDAETHALHEEVEDLMAQKERIERALERKSDALQHAKYDVFDAIEAIIESSAPALRSTLHQIKLQSVDLFDILEEIVESAIITTLERGHDIEETIEEITKEVTYETLEEGELGALRVQKVLSTILQSAINVAEATPNHQDTILRGSLRGVRSGLIRSIERFRQQLLYMPDEVKSMLAEDYQALQNEIHQMDALFEQVIHTLAYQNCPTTQKSLMAISKEIRFDMEELAHISKETVEVMRDRFSVLAKEAVERGSKMLKSKTATEAKRMGVQAWGVAKSAIDGAIRSAKDVMEKKEK